MSVAIPPTMEEEPLCAMSCVLSRQAVMQCVLKERGKRKQVRLHVIDESGSWRSWYKINEFRAKANKRNW